MIEWEAIQEGAQERAALGRAQWRSFRCSRSRDVAREVGQRSRNSISCYLSVRSRPVHEEECDDAGI